MRMKALLYVVSGAGAAAAAFGFGIAYYAIVRYEPRAYHFVLTTLGVLAAAYGFYQAFSSIRRRRIAVGSTALAFAVIAAGTASTVYGFTQAYRGLGLATPGPWRVFWGVLIAAGLVASLFGLWCGLRFVLAEQKKRRSS
ncbi:MAG: hypothetical protein AB1792_03695 [Candidatus Zixiibacteriota bacterium]